MPELTSGAVCKMFNVAPTTLVSWSERGFLPPSGGTWKRYGRAELMQVAALVELGKIGKLTRGAAEAAQEVAASAHLGASRFIGHPAPETMTVVVVIWDRDEDEIQALATNWASVPHYVAARNKGAAAIVFDTVKLRREVEEKLAKINPETDQ